MFTVIIEHNENWHETTITDWRTGEVSPFFTSEPGFKIPSKSDLVLDVNKIKQAQEESAWIMGLFGK